MQALNPVLRTLYVLVPPSAPIVLPADTPSQGGLGAGAVAGICLAAVVAGGALAWFLYWYLYPPPPVRVGAPMIYYPVSGGRWEARRLY